MLVKAYLPENILLMNMYSLMNRVFTFHIQNIRIEKYKDKVWAIFVLYTSWDELMKDTTTVVDFSLWCMAFWWNIWLIKQDCCIHVAVMISSILHDFTDCKVERRARTRRAKCIARLLQGLNLRGNVPMDFKSITLTTRSNSRCWPPKKYTNINTSNKSLFPFSF